MKKRIIIDMDWVIAKLTKKWLKYYNEENDDDLQISDITEWDICKFVKPGAKQSMLELLNRDGFYRDLEVVEDSVEVLRELSEDYELFICTDPFGPYSLRDKYEWLLEHFPFIKAENFIFTGNKSIVNGEYMIDDAVHHIEKFKGEKLLFGAPYNINETRFTRLSSWLEIREYFRDRTNV